MTSYGNICDGVSRRSTAVRDHRIFERTLRPLVFRGACLFERHYNHSSLGLVLGFAVSRPLKSVAVPSGSKRSNSLAIESRWLPARTPHFLRLTSDQVGIPAELKHINKRRKRNQQGLPQ